MPAGGGLADAVMAMAAVAAAIGRRFVLPAVSLAETAVAVSGGRLLAPGWPGAGATRVDPAADVDAAVILCAVVCSRTAKEAAGGGRR